MTPRAILAFVVPVIACATTAIIGLGTSADALATKPHRPSVTTHSATRSPMNKQFCVYSAQTIGQLHNFEKLVGAPVNCALLFNSTNRSWAQWSSPWFLHSPNDPDYAWPGWKKAKAGRRLIVTTSLAPTRGLPRNWMARGAAGKYKVYAKRLATNLVKAGLGDSVIRISHEANATWNFDRVPNSANGQRSWRVFWAKTVTAMRSVRGAHFRFDWTVNYQVRPGIDLRRFYPGNKFVDIIGLDAYDENTTRMTGRFKFQQTRAGGINEVVRFARARHKQLSFPEWGLIPVGSSMQGGGDQPDYIRGIGDTVAKYNFAYTSYWYAHGDTRSLIANSRGSLSVLRADFGPRGRARR